MKNMVICESAFTTSDTISNKNTVSIVKYSPEYKFQWDKFITTSKNGVFVFYRDYMEYHSDRFHDNSRLFFKKGKLIGLMPANIKNNVLNSHEGLTFGGIISDNEMKTSIMMEIFEKIIMYCKEEGFTELIYKKIPYIYHQIPAEEDSYALFRHNAKLIGREIISSIQMPLNVNYTKERTRTIKKQKVTILLLNGALILKPS